MNRHSHDLAGQVAARDQGMARMRAAAAGTTVASLVAAGAIALSLPGGASNASAAAHTAQSSQSSQASTSKSASDGSAKSTRSAKSTKLTAPGAAPTASSSSGQTTSGGS